MKSRKKRESAAYAPVDVHVGKRIKIRRKACGLTLAALGELIGMSLQQTQKYESGANRIGASRLFELSDVLDVPISFFFDDMNEKTRATRGRRIDPKTLADNDQTELESDPLARRETLELVRAYYKIDDPKVRKRLFELTKTLANSLNAD